MPRPSKKRTTTNSNPPEETETVKRQKTTSRSSKSNEESKFNTNRLIAWFKNYTSDEVDIGPDGMERFCIDIGVQPEDIVMLVIAYKMNAKRMGYFSQSEFVKGLSDPEVLCDTPTKLQNKLDYFYNLMNDPQTFKMIFRYGYDFARDKDQRSMDIETAKAMLSLLLSKSWPLYSEFAEFLNQPKAPRVINKDQWNNIFEFSRTINIDLSNYSIDGAWPVLLDDFVEYLQKKRQANSS